MPERLLLCADLCRTLIPNGLQPESSVARAHLAAAGSIPSIVVANSEAAVQAEALRQCVGNRNQGLCIARGGFNGMNGNCSVGILEGTAFYHPGLESRMALGPAT